MKHLHNKRLANLQTIIIKNEKLRRTLSDAIMSKGIKLKKKEIDALMFASKDEIESSLDSIEIADLSDEEVEVIVNAYKVELEKVISEYNLSIPEQIEEAAIWVTNEVKRERDKDIRRIRRIRRKFQDRHEREWDKPLGLLEHFIDFVHELAYQLREEISENAVLKEEFWPMMYRYKALFGLHARACLVSQEVLSLLRAGFADGAHARWRTLQELTYVALFISEQDEETAEMYLLHDVMEVKKGLDEQLEHKDFTKEEISEEYAIEIQTEYSSLIQRFGNNFKSDFGWAIKVLGDKRLTFRDIAAAVDFSHWGPYYQMANINVHAGSHGSKFKLGLKDVENLLLTGPSNGGLALPGHSTSQMLGFCTQALLFLDTTMDNVAYQKTLYTLIEEIGEAFSEVEDKLIIRLMR